jgi:hypothetical protein
MKLQNLIILLTLIFVGCSNENTAVAQSDKSDDGILSKIEEMMSGKGIPSEAFIVLKNDEVRYMADMEIIFFEDSVKDAFQKLCQERREAQKKMSIEAIRDNPEMANAMKRLEAAREEIAEREKSIDGKVEEMRVSLVSDLRQTLAGLSKQLEDGGKVLEEFKEITTPFDNAIRKTQQNLTDLKEDETKEKWDKEAFEILNNYIVSNELEMPKFKNPEGFLRVNFQEGTYYDFEARKYSKAWIWDFERNGRQALYKDLGTPMEIYHAWDKSSTWVEMLKLILPLAKKKGYLMEECSSLRSIISSREFSRNKALIPWENRHDVDQDEFEEQYGRITRDYENNKQRLDALLSGGPEKDQILKEMIVQIKDEISEQRENLEEVESKIQEEAIESMSEALRSTYYNKFVSMLGNESELSIRTGSKGDFIIPSGMDYLFATRSRDNGENIFWFLKIDPKFGNFRLSNSNAKFVGEYGDKMTWMYDFVLE